MCSGSAMRTVSGSRCRPRTPTTRFSISRLAAETIFRSVWHGGDEAGDATRLAALAAQLKPKRDMNSDENKALLKRNTDEALQLGVFGTPAYVVDGRLFWGFDSKS